MDPDRDPGMNNESLSGLPEGFDPESIVFDPQIQALFQAESPDELLEILHSKLSELVDIDPEMLVQRLGDELVFLTDLPTRDDQDVEHNPSRINNVSPQSVDKDRYEALVSTVFTSEILIAMGDLVTNKQVHQVVHLASSLLKSMLRESDMSVITDQEFYVDEYTEGSPPQAA